MEKVNRENCERLNNFEHITLKNRDGSRLRARRNGVTKTWKRVSDFFTIPIKHGLYDYGYITEWNCNEWEGE